MEIKEIVDELEAYASDNYKPFVSRFTERKWDDDTWKLHTNKLRIVTLKIDVATDTCSISLAVDDKDAFEELKGHADYIKSNYGVNVGYNGECSCKLMKDETDWNDTKSKEAIFDWIIMNAQMLQDIAERYLSSFEEKELQGNHKMQDFIDRNQDAIKEDTSDNYETKKIFAQTNTRTGIRYKIIHRKSKDRHEIWTNDHGKRNRINNAEVEKIKQDRNAMIQYVKDNLL